MPVSKEEDEKLYDIAMQKVQAEYGEDFDEFDDRIKSRVTTVKNEITAQYRMDKKIQTSKNDTLNQLPADAPTKPYDSVAHGKRDARLTAGKCG